MKISGNYCILCCTKIANDSNNNLKFIAGTQYDDNKEENPFVLCENCVATCAETIQQTKSHSPKNNFKATLTPRSIVEHLNQYVIGQDEAKKALAVAVYNHYKRLNSPTINGVEISKSNMLMIGPTGSGKTLLVQSIAKLLDVPFAIADATSLTEAGYVGDDVETILQRLIASADGDLEKAKKGIIFIDEIDKLAKRNAGASITRDVSGEGVQQALLKILEGTSARISQHESRKHPGSVVNELDTTNILFICGGAFVGLDKIIENKTSHKSMGFAMDSIPEEELQMRDMLNSLGNSITADDLSSFGLIPEFIGRLPVIIELKELSKEQLRQVITEPKNAVLKQMQGLFALENVELTFSDKAIEQIVDLAVARKTGARGIRSILEKVLNNLMFDLPELQNSSIHIDDIYLEPKIISQKAA